MRRLVLYSLILLLAIILEIGVLGRFLSGFYLSIVTPLVFFGFLILPFEQILVVAATAGFILDVAYLSRSVAATVYLIAELILLRFFSRLFVNLRSGFGVFLSLFVLILLQAAVRLFLSGGIGFNIRLAIIAFALLAWSAAFYLIYFLLGRTGIWQKE